MLIYIVPKDWNLMNLMPIPHRQRYYLATLWCTVPSRFLRNENHVARQTILIVRDKNQVAQESLKWQFLA